MRSPSTFFLGFGQGFALLCFCFFLVGLGTISLFLVGSKSNVSAFFRLQFRNGLGTKPAGALLFRMRSPSTFFLGFALFLLIFSGFLKQRFGIFQAAVSQWKAQNLLGLCFFACAPQAPFSWVLGRVLPCFCLLIFSGFQKQRFGIFQAIVSQWLGHKTCWGSAFSHALPKHLFLGFCLVFSGFQKQRFGIFVAAVSHGLGTISLFLVWVPKATFRHLSGCSFAMA